VTPLRPAALRPPAAAREPLVDALRALALAGVLVVNAMSYPGGPSGSPLGLPAPAGSPLDLLAFTAVAWLLQGKAYPLLTFLFGYSLALATRRQDDAALAYRGRRLLRLLVLGVLHGALLFAGDILTVYAITGLVVLGWARLPLRRLVVRWGLFAALALAIVAMNVTLSLTGVFGDLGFAAGPGYAHATDAGDFLWLNASAYLGSLAGGVVLFLPEVLMLMLAGFIAGRLRWLTHPRWQVARHRAWRRWLPAALLLNLGYALFMAWAASHDSPLQWVGLSAGPPAGWLLAATALAALSWWWRMRKPVLLQAVSPLGHYTLSVYVGHSLLCALLFSGAGLGWTAGTLGWLGWGLGLWLACAWLAIGAARLGLRGPLEAWMIRA
jgi:uncharacterized protein